MTVNSIADLRNTAGSSTNNFCRVLYYDQLRDGGGGDFLWDANNTTADNAGTIFQVNGVVTGRWVRIYSGPLNVRWFGVQGNGTTDDTAALQHCFQVTPSRHAIYFPRGTYIIDSAAILLKGKNNVEIFGDGVASILRPSNQGVAPIKQYYHCTLAIDECEHIIIRDLTIESKGESYGDADAGKEIPKGDQRTEFTINNGGSPLLITRSRDVYARNLVGRRCGSVGVFYASVCSDIVFESCFANAYAVGYAGFCADNWVTNDGEFNRTYSFINCTMHKESNPFAGKSGVIVEGDAGYIITAVVDGGLFCDLRGNQLALREGLPLDMTDCNVFAKNVVGYNNDSSCKLAVRGNLQDVITHDIQNCSFFGNLVLGFDLNYQPTGEGSVSCFIKGITQTVAEESRWATDSEWGPATDIFKYRYTTAINLSFYARNIKTIQIEKFTSSGSQYGVRSQDRYPFSLIDCNISSKNNALLLASGYCQIIGGSLTCREGAWAQIDTKNITDSGTSVGDNYADLLINGATISSEDNSQLIDFIGNIHLLRTWIVKNNAIINGMMNMPALTSLTENRDIDEFLKAQQLVVNEDATYVNSGTQPYVQFFVRGLQNNSHYEDSKTRLIAEGVPSSTTIEIQATGTAANTEIRIYGVDISADFPANKIITVFTPGF
ncbi:MAG: glycosyl hydrolase family 28-related protein [Pseudosphingobacterium sp.]|nr:hypothetical protein [Olivibacter sp. UJ_SKK_5.1]MDX3912704.1 glycosyl hydrolase family 28-related protein [Pseudosphingobacterium sp.]